MSSLGGQWRVIRHYLSLTNLHSEVEKLVQKIKPASPQQWDNLIKKFENVISARVPNTKDLTIDKLQEGSKLKSTSVEESEAKTNVVSETKEMKQKESPPGVVSDLKELTVEGLWRGLKLNKDIHLGKISEPTWKPNKHAMSKQSSIQSRTLYVVSAISTAESIESTASRVQRLIEHLHEYPEARDHAIRAGAIRALLRVRRPLGTEGESDVRGTVNEALSLLGYVGGPRWFGANVLSLDGGGIRGIVAIEILKHIERITGRRINELFDYIIGVSTGAIIAAVLGSGVGSLDEARRLYVTLSRDMFGNTTRLGGTSRLVWTHAYYDTSAWERLLQEHLGDVTLLACNRSDMPKMALVSCVMNSGAGPVPYLFRTYEVGYRYRSVYSGTCVAKVWEGVRASAAAPTYFDEFNMCGLLLQDGGIVVNNPTGVAVHEARLLYGAREMARGTVVSVGTGRAPRCDVTRAHTTHSATSWRDKFNKILDSATDTEGVHLVMNDLLPAGSYFRFNPPLTQECAMDEIDQRKLDDILLDTMAYIRRNQHKFDRVASRLTRTRGVTQRAIDYVTERAHIAGIITH